LKRSTAPVLVNLPNWHRSDVYEKQVRHLSKKKVPVIDIDRTIYDIKDKENASFKVSKGLTPDIVRQISVEKNDPKWMLDFRLKSLEVYNRLKLPVWGPSLHELDMDNIVTYVRPDTEMRGNWSEVPDDIKNTFERLGIPKAERDYLAGVGAQYDSEVVYHSVRDEVVKQGVIYTDMESAIKEYPDIVKSHFMKLVKPEDHKFAALHGAVWSGGSFVYVPAGVKVSIPLQSYFRLNAPGAGQFEHTLIIVEKGASLHFIEGCSAPKYNVTNLHAGCVELYVGEGASLRYSTIENWSKNMMNLNTKRARVEKNGKIEWISGSFGSKVSMLYPMSILSGEGAKAEFTGITFAGQGQTLDTGANIVHDAPHTYSVVNARSISKDGGVSIFRGGVTVTEKARQSKSSVSCESLMLDSISRSDTIPAMDIRNDESDVGHEARIGRISDDAIYYLMSRGISEPDARALIVRGFADPVAKELPMEYAVEMNNLINLEMENHSTGLKGGKE
jgi:Fe-S cluster assembly protein SufB